MCRLSGWKAWVVLFIAGCILLHAYRMYTSSPSVEEPQEIPRTPETAELIFIGGHESTGTGLMRVMLDAHPLIRCGAEPMVTLEILNMRHSIKGVRRQRAIKAGVYPEAYDQAVASFILKVVERMGSPAPYICHKQPMTFNYLGYLGFLFPKAKFIHMIRDGRAVVASSITRGLGPKFGRDQQHEALKRWERIVIPILRDCQDIGKARCITVRYEKLVLQTEDETRKLFAFLGIPWDPVVLQHEVVLTNLTNLNPFEPSTKQITHKIYTDSLAQWTGPDSVLDMEFIQTAHQESRLLQLLGYANVGNPPNYDTLPSSIPIFRF